MDGWTDGGMDGGTDGGTDGGMDGWMDGWMVWRYGRTDQRIDDDLQRGHAVWTCSMHMQHR